MLTAQLHKIIIIVIASLSLLDLDITLEGLKKGGSTIFFSRIGVFVKQIPSVAFIKQAINKGKTITFIATAIALSAGNEMVPRACMYR